MRSEPRLATFWEQATFGVNYVRAVLPARYLPGRSQLLRDVVNDLSLKKHPFLNEDLPEFDFSRVQEGASIWLFSGNTTRGQVMAEMLLQGIPTFMEVDDNYTSHPPYNLGNWEKKIPENYMEYDAHSYEGHMILTKHCDGLICSTQFLADLYDAKGLNDNIHVCRNAVDPLDWPDDPTHQPDGVLRIGWAASDSHKPDASLVYRALDWASWQPDVEVVIVGILPEITGFRFNYRYIPFQDEMGDYRRELGNIDVMLCPLREGIWNDCKSDLKALEGAMGGALPVVSKVEAYRPWWDGEAPVSYSATTEKEFLKLVKHLVRNRDEVREGARQAKEYVLNERNIHSTVQEWREAVSSVG